MRHSAIVIMMLSVGLVLVSCKDFLDLSPETRLNTGNFFQTEDQFNQALSGAYAPLRTYAGTSGWTMAELRSDNTHYDFNSTNRGIGALEREDIANFLDEANNSHTRQKYTNDYVGIARANTIIGRIDAANLPQAFKSAIVAEAKFLRAFYYFDLVQYFGDVPLYLQEVQNPEQAVLPRAAAQDVYVAIVADLTDAIQLFAPTVGFPQTGRASIGSAKTLLAHVHMVRKDFAAAEKLLKEVTQLGYSLLPDYASVYSLGNKNSRESVFEIQFMQGVNGVNSNFAYLFLPRMTAASLITGVPGTNTADGGWNVPTDDLISSYEPGDKRLDASIGIVEGTLDASGNLIPEGIKSIVDYEAPAGKVGKRFIRKYLHAHTMPNNTDDNWPVYRYAEVLLFLAECLNEQGKPGEALPYLNQVRGPRTGLSAITETDQQLLRTIIARERRVELAFENKRWLDLVRTQNATEVMTAFGTAIKQKDPNVPARGYQLTASKLLFPIPLTEVQRNPAIAPTPGYTY